MPSTSAGHMLRGSDGVEEQKEEAVLLDEDVPALTSSSEPDAPGHVGDEHGFQAQMGEIIKVLFGNCGNFIEQAAYCVQDRTCGRPDNRNPQRTNQQQQQQHLQQHQQQNRQLPQNPNMMYHPGSGALPYPPPPHLLNPQIQPHYAQHCYHSAPEPPPLSIADELRQLAARTGIPIPPPPNRNGRDIPKILREDQLDDDDNISCISAHTLEEMARINHTNVPHGSIQGVLHPMCQQKQQASMSSLPSVGEEKRGLD